MISAILVALVILSAIQLGGQAVVFSLVHLNYVATWSELPIANVPYYNASNTFAKSVQRYSLDWWLLFFDFFDFFIPGIIFMTYIGALRGSKSFLWINWGYLIFVGILNLGRFAYRLFWQFPFCNSFGNLCRSTDPSNPASAYVTDNLLWMTLITYNGVFLFWLMLYAVISSKISVQIEYDRQDINKTFLKSKNIPIQSIDLLLTNARVAIFIIDKNGKPYPEQISPVFSKGGVGVGSGGGNSKKPNQNQPPPSFFNLTEGGGKENQQSFPQRKNDDTYENLYEPFLQDTPPPYSGANIQTLNSGDLIKNNGSGKFFLVQKQPQFVKNSVSQVMDIGKKITSGLLNGNELRTKIE